MESILASTLQDCIDTYTANNGVVAQDVKNTLSKFGLYNEDSPYYADNLLLVSKLSMGKDEYVVCVSGKLNAIDKDLTDKMSKSEGKKVVGEPSDEHHKVVSDKKLTSPDEISRIIKSASYTIDVVKIKEHLEKFIKSIEPEEESYKVGDVTIKHYGPIKPDINNLVASGTKILDAILFVALHSEASSQGLFKLVEVTELSEKYVAENVTSAKRAVQAAVVLTFIQGDLPKGEARSLPKFIKENIFKGEISDSKALSSMLSCTSLGKFPSRIILGIDVNTLPIPVASRCKLGVAGNRAVRYATFVAGMSQRQEQKIVANEGTDLSALFNQNQRLKQAKSIVAYLQAVQSSFEAQLKMHPLSPNKPVLKDFTKKMTRAIIESLSASGRAELISKLKQNKNPAFLADPLFAGVEDDKGVRTWPILQNSEYDFSEHNISSLKAIYGVDFKGE